MAKSGMPQDVLDEVRFLVWTGLKNNDDILDDLAEMYADDESLDPQRVEEAVLNEFEAKALQEADWPELASGDLVADLFIQLIEHGVLAVECLGEDTADGQRSIQGAYEGVADEDRHEVKGYCFFSIASLQAAIAGEPLRVDFGTFGGPPNVARDLGTVITRKAQSLGLKIEPAADATNAVLIGGMPWHRHSALWAASRLHQQLAYVFEQHNAGVTDYWIEFSHPQRDKSWIRVTPHSVRVSSSPKSDPLKSLQDAKVSIPSCLSQPKSDTGKYVTFKLDPSDYPIGELAEFISQTFQNLFKVTEPISELEWEDSDDEIE